MATSRPFAYNTGASIPGTQQIGNLAVGTPSSGFEPTGLKWWNGPDEDLGYVIAHQNPTGQPGADGTTANLGFWRSSGKIESNFIDLSEDIARLENDPQNFSSGGEAKTWLNDNGYWTSYQGIIENGLIIQLDANDINSYPGSGTAVYDLTGPYDHTLTGATYTVLNGIKCFDCTTGTNRVVVDGTGPILPTTGYTYITWARVEEGNPLSFRTLLYTNSPKYTPITIPNGTNTLGYWDTEFRSSGYDLSSSVGVWVQYAIVGDSSSQTFYINGSQVGSPIAFGSGDRTHWGWGNNNVPQPWGYVANLYLYDRKLSLSEISQQYNFLSSRFV